jgi:uncharacterized protein (TIGR02466 family)
MIVELFPTPIYLHKGNFNETFLIQKEIEKAWLNIKNDKFEKPYSWEQDVKTNINYRWNSIKDFELKNLFYYIDNHVKKYWQSVMPTEGKEIFMAHSWFNITTSGGGQEWHAHTDSIISGTYYYKTTGKEGRIGFKNPVPFTKNGLFPAGGRTPEKQYVEVNEGMLILFPGWLDHQVEVNTTNNDRITIAFNYQTVNIERQGLIKNEKTN